MSKTYIEEFFVAYAIKALQDGGNMTEYISDWLTDSLFSNGFINEGDREIYHYSIQVMIEKIIGFSTIFFLAFLWEKLLETIMFVFCFSYIRKYSGGFHSRSFAGCYIGTITIYVAYYNRDILYFDIYDSWNGRKVYSVYEFWIGTECSVVSTWKNNLSGGEKGMK